MLVVPQALYTTKRFYSDANALNKPPGNYDVQDWNLKELAWKLVRRWRMLF